MLVRARAPLRLGLAGGGTDLAPYCDDYGGAVLNATIDLYAYSTIEPMKGNYVEFISDDIGEVLRFPAGTRVPTDHKLALHAGVYNRIISTFAQDERLALRLSTFCEAPPGSGLGSSSTLVVSMLKAFMEYLSLGLGDYDLGHLAFEIERIDLGLAGGRQDQYAATFGGFNFMEFHKDNFVIVNPLRIKNWILAELETSIVLFYTGQSRESSNIINEQIKNVSEGNKSLEAMHELKQEAYAMKEAVLRGDVGRFAGILNKSWIAKKRTSSVVSNPSIDNVFEVAKGAGALGGKVSGAGGGGFITFFVNPTSRTQLIKALQACPGQVFTCHFTRKGTEGWKIY